LGVDGKKKSFDCSEGAVERGPEREEDNGEASVGGREMERESRGGEREGDVFIN
jgi:hypothetical protein